MKDSRIVTTEAESREAGKRARAAAKNMTVIVGARYAKPQDAIIVRLNTGSTFIVPRTRLPGFEKIEPVALRKPEIGARPWPRDCCRGALGGRGFFVSAHRRRPARIADRTSSAVEDRVLYGRDFHAAGPRQVSNRP